MAYVAGQRARRFCIGMVFAWLALHLQDGRLGLYDAAFRMEAGGGRIGDRFDGRGGAVGRFYSTLPDGGLVGWDSRGAGCDAIMCLLMCRVLRICPGCSFEELFFGSCFVGGGDAAIGRTRICRRSGASGDLQCVSSYRAITVSVTHLHRAQVIINF